MITSAKNVQVKNIIQLNKKPKARREQKLFIAEGKKMFGEAPPSWVERVYVAASQSEDKELMDRVERYPWEAVEDSVFCQMSDTKTPQGVLTVLKQPHYNMEEILKTRAEAEGLKAPAPFLMVLEDIQDPGNLGTILRTGEGAGISGLILTKTCVDITNPKVIRATMGSIYRVPFVWAEDVVQIKEELKKKEICLYAAHLRGKNTYDCEDYRPGTAFLIGNEGKGLTENAAAAADRLIRIPMSGRVESLNAAMAAGILMYEAARQRRKRILDGKTKKEELENG